MTLNWYHMVGAWVVAWVGLVVMSQRSSAISWVALGLVAAHVADWIMKATRNAMKRNNIDAKGKAVFVTGCDSGFGNQLAAKLCDQGFKVYAGCLNPDGIGATSLKKKACERMHILRLDVTKDEDVRAAYKYVDQDLATDEVLWAVVNNAGIAAFTEIEWCPIAEYRRVYEVNSLGPIRVTKTFLPKLRQSKGRVVLVASLAGRYTFPGFTAYSMSKHATVSFADGLRLEMQKWGISVHTVEPTLYRTPISQEGPIHSALDRFWQDCSEDVRESYGDEYIKDFKITITNHLNRAKPTEKICEVIDDMFDAVAGDDPKTRYVPSVVTQIRAKLLSSLPENVRDTFFLKAQPQTPPAFVKAERDRKGQRALVDPRPQDRRQRLTRMFSMPNWGKKELTPSPKIETHEPRFSITSMKMKGVFASVVHGVKAMHRVVLWQTRRYIVTKNKTGTPSSPWDIVFFGTDEFSLKCLEVIHKEQLKGELVRRLEVVTISLDKPEPAVRKYCGRKGILLHTWPPSEQSLQGFHIGLVVSFGHLIPAKIISAFPLGIINVHGSLLPRWRGASPVIHALLHGDTYTGITIMRIHPNRFDVGSIVSHAVVPVAWNTKSAALTNELAVVGAAEVISVLHSLPQKLHNAVPQASVGITKAPKVSVATSRVSWSEHTCWQIQCMFRALDDYFPLWTLWQDTPLKLRGLVMREELCKENEIKESSSSSSNSLQCRQSLYNLPELKGRREHRDIKMYGINVEKDNVSNVHRDSEFKSESNLIKNDTKMNSNSTDRTYEILDNTSTVKIESINMKTAIISDTNVDSNSTDASPGTFVYNRKLKFIQVQCKNGWVSFQRVIVRGRKPMNAQDFYNGFVSKVPKHQWRFT